MRSSSAVVVVLVAAGAADHDLVLLDRDLDRAVAGPVLGVDGVVLHGGIEPQSVALLAMVEGALERAPCRGALARAARAAAAAARPALFGLRVALGLVRGLLVVGGRALGLLGGPRLVLGGLARGLLG